MRKIIAALQVSLDGHIEGPNGEIDWINSWEDPFDLLGQIDTCVQGGKEIHAVGGAALVSSLINAGLVDELRLVVVPVLLGAGKPLFQGIAARHPLQFSGVKLLDGGLTRLTYTLGTQKPTRHLAPSLMSKRAGECSLHQA